MCETVGGTKTGDGLTRGLAFPESNRQDTHQKISHGVYNLVDYYYPMRNSAQIAIYFQLNANKLSPRSRQVVPATWLQGK